MKTRLIFLSWIVLTFLLNTESAKAEGYIGGGFGIAEACRSLYKPSFSGGDCIHRDAAIRAYVGNDISDFFAIEGSADFAFDAGNIGEIILDNIFSKSNNDSLNYYSNNNYYETTGRWSTFTFGLHALAKLPITRDFVLFAGPSVGASYSEVDRGVKYFDNNTDPYSNTTYGFGTNYGFTCGVDLFNSYAGGVRLQWQNWRSIDSNAATSGHFNMNLLSINFRGRF